MIKQGGIVFQGAGNWGSRQTLAHGRTSRALLPRSGPVSTNYR
jgi:hypothetical protein